MIEDNYIEARKELNKRCQFRVAVVYKNLDWAADVFQIIGFNQGLGFLNQKIIIDNHFEVVTPWVTFDFIDVTKPFELKMSHYDKVIYDVEVSKTAREDFMKFYDVTEGKPIVLDFKGKEDVANTKAPEREVSA